MTFDPCGQPLGNLRSGICLMLSSLTLTLSRMIYQKQPDLILAGKQETTRGESGGRDTSDTSR
jgi:hypothetical protein